MIPKYTLPAEGLWFISDTHFGHKNIMRHAKRPFANIDEHDAEIATVWAASVRPTDTIFHLGDVGFHDPKRLGAILEKLPGQKYLVLGNHDQPIRGPAKTPWRDILTYAELKVGQDEQRVVLSHYPFEFWNRSHYGAYHFHGHCHGNVPAHGKARVDVGVDGHPPEGLPAHYGPIAYLDIVAHLQKRKPAASYHHPENAY